MLRVSVGRALVRGLCRGAYRDFIRSMGEADRRQERLLGRLIRDLSATEYGRSVHLQPSDDYAAFARKVPVVSYDDISAFIERCRLGEQNLLTRRKIIAFERTSGGRDSAKHIPYTRALKKSFARMFKIWACDLLEHLYQPQTGRIFMLVSPDTLDRAADKSSPSSTAGDDDSRYLGSLLRCTLSPFLIMPEGFEVDSPLRAVEAAIAKYDDLELISLWSPSLFCVILDRLDVKTPDDARRRWPQLKLISCWTCGPSSLFADRIRNLFPHVHVQGKGLLATEAPITIPWVAANGCVPLVDEVFLEFEDDAGRVLRLHELEDETIYTVIISQKGGLHRYRLGDLVRVRGTYRSVPLLDFIGRSDRVCDLVGEKLSELYLQAAICPLVDDYFCVLPFLDNGSAGYELFVDLRHRLSAAAGEEALMANFHYRTARQLGQLAPLRLTLVSGLLEQVQTFHFLRGMKLGDFKPPVLIADLDQSRDLKEFLVRAGQRTPQENRE